MSSAAIPSIFDTQSLSALKRGLRQDDPQALKAAARQFEAMFLQMMLKSMRATVPQDGLFESDQTRFYQELLDAQLAQVMAAKGGMGLAALIERQLSRPQEAVPEPDAAGLPLALPPRALPLEPGPQGLPLPATDAGGAVSPEPTFSAAGADTPQARFVAAVRSHAEAASRATGIPAAFLIAHAALESGWGRAEPRHPDGRPSHNLFGIKAGSGWPGAVVEATTTEYASGVAERRIERFRAYASYAEAFADYARLLRERYAEAVGSRDAASFAWALVRGGYATDPAYAQKLVRVISQLG